MNRHSLFATGLAAILTMSAAPSVVRGQSQALISQSVEAKQYVEYGDLVYEWINEPAKAPEGVQFYEGHGGFEQYNGSIYLAQSARDTNKNNVDNIWVFSSTYAPGKGFAFQRSFGRFSPVAAHGIAIQEEVNTQTEENNAFVYLTYNAPNRTNDGMIVKSDLQGKEIWRLGAPQASQLNGKPVYTKPGQFNPTSVAFTSAGNVLVADGYGRNAIHEYEPNGTYVRSFGGTGTKPGQFNTPHGLTVRQVDGVENVVVADRANGRIQYFTRNDQGDFVVRKVFGNRSGGIKYTPEEAKLVTQLEGTYDGLKEIVGDELRNPCNIRFGNGMFVIPDLNHRVSLYDESTGKVVAHLGDGNPPYKRIEGYPFRGANPPIWNKYFAGPHFADFVKVRDGTTEDVLVSQWVVKGSGLVLMKRVQ